MGLYIQPSSVNWDKVLEIVLSWIASPLLGGLLAFTSFIIIKRVIMNHPNPLQKTREVAPIMALPTFFVLGLALQFKALKGFYSNLDSAGIIDQSEWLPAKAGTTFNPLAEGAWIPMNALLAALVIGILASLILWLSSEERRVGRDGRSRRSKYHLNNIIKFILILLSLDRKNAV